MAADLRLKLFYCTWPVNIALHLALKCYDTQNICQYVLDVYLNAAKYTKNIYTLYFVCICVTQSTLCQRVHLNAAFEVNRSALLMQKHHAEPCSCSRSQDQPNRTTGWGAGRINRLCAQWSTQCNCISTHLPVPCLHMHRKLKRKTR